MAPPGLDLGTHSHAPSYNALLEDPFVSKVDGSSAVSVPDTVSIETADSGEDTNSDTTLAAGPGIFGHAPLYQRASSAVKMPSSPSSRNLNKLITLQGSPRPQRASSSSLNAGAAPFQPKSTSPSSEGGDKRNFTYPLSSHDLLAQDHYPVQAINNPERSLPRDEGLHHEASAPVVFNESQTQLWQSSGGPVESAHSSRNPGAAVPFDARFTTPPDTSQLWYSMQDKRRLAHSDEPFLYQHPTVPELAATPSRVQANRKANFASVCDQDLRPFPSDYVVQQQHHLSSHPSFSMPHPARRDSKSFDFLRSDRASYMLNYLPQASYQGDQNGDTPQANVFDHYTPTPSVSSQNHAAPPAQINPYSQDGNAMGSSAYFPGSTNYPQQVSPLSSPGALQSLTSLEATASPLRGTTASPRPQPTESENRTGLLHSRKPASSLDPQNGS